MILNDLLVQDVYNYITNLKNQIGIEDLLDTVDTYICNNNKFIDILVSYQKHYSTDDLSIVSTLLAADLIEIIAKTYDNNIFNLFMANIYCEVNKNQIKDSIDILCDELNCSILNNVNNTKNIEQDIKNIYDELITNIKKGFDDINVLEIR